MFIFNNISEVHYYINFKHKLKLYKHVISTYKYILIILIKGYLFCIEQGSLVILYDKTKFT